MIVKRLPLRFEDITNRYNTQTEDAFWCSDKAPGHILDMLCKDMFLGSNWTIHSHGYDENYGPVRDAYWLSIPIQLMDDIKAIPGFIDREHYPTPPIFDNEIGTRNNLRFLVDTEIPIGFESSNDKYYACVCWGSPDDSGNYRPEDFRVITIPFKKTTMTNCKWNKELTDPILKMNCTENCGENSCLSKTE